MELWISDLYQFILAERKRIRRLKVINSHLYYSDSFRTQVIDIKSEKSGKGITVQDFINKIK